MKKRGTVIQAPPEDVWKEVRERTGFTNQQIESYMAKFSRYDSHGQGVLSFYEIDDYFKDCNLIVSPQTKQWLGKQLKDKNQRTLDFKAVCDLMVDCIKFNEDLEDEDTSSGEYIDAFVAMGGNPDKTGYVKKDTIIDIIKNEFELTFNMEDLLESFGHHQQLDFDTFCLLFEQGGEDARSVLSAFSERARKTNISSFQVRYKDFERWVQQMDG